MNFLIDCNPHVALLKVMWKWSVSICPSVLNVSSAQLFSTAYWLPGILILWYHECSRRTTGTKVSSILCRFKVVTAHKNHWCLGDSTLISNQLCGALVECMFQPTTAVVALTATGYRLKYSKLELLSNAVRTKLNDIFDCQTDTYKKSLSNLSETIVKLVQINCQI